MEIALGIALLAIVIYLIARIELIKKSVDENSGVIINTHYLLDKSFKEYSLEKTSRGQHDEYVYYIRNCVDTIKFENRDTSSAIMRGIQEIEYLKDRISSIVGGLQSTHSDRNFRSLRDELASIRDCISDFESRLK